MENKRNWLGIGLILVLSIFILSACSGSKSESNGNDDGSSNDGQSYGGTLNFAFNAQPPTLDPTGTTATATRDIVRPIFEQLVAFDANLEVQPMLAESYEVDNDEATITFDLRQGIKFHNGDEMLAEDVVASMEKWAAESAQARSFLPDVTFEADGDHTVVAQLDKTGLIDMYIFADITQIAAIMPKDVIHNAGDQGITEFIGTGPYKFVEWKQDQHVHLEKFEDYQSLEGPTDGLVGGKAGYADEIYFHFVTDSSTRVAGIQSGEYELANVIPQDNALQLADDPNVSYETELESFPGIVFNNKEGIMSDKQMRQAVAAALDFDEMMLAAYGSEEFYSMDHELMLKDQDAWYTDAGIDQYNQKDTEKAKELLDESGYDGEEIKIITSREYEDYYTFSVVMQEKLKEIGMNIEIDVVEWATVLELREDPSAYDMFLSGWGIRPTPVQYPFLDSRAEWPGWTDNPEIDDLIDKITETTSQEEAKQFTEELQEEFWDYLPILKPGNRLNITAHRTNVEGYEALIGPILWNVSIEDE